MEHLTTWIKAKRGRLSRLSEALGITAGAISQWTEVPAERMGDVSRFTGIPLRKLRPDIFERAKTPAQHTGAAA
jgi:hypothetical protein